jgi:serine/threonine protein kinase
MADNSMVLGVLAVQLGFATPAQVMAAASGWMADKSEGLAERLEKNGTLTAERRKVLEGLVAEALRANGGDEAKTLATVGGNEAVFMSFGGALSLAPAGLVTGAPLSDQEDKAVTHEQPGRYTIKNEHGRGGQSQIFLAVDEHIGREIALKQLLPEAKALDVANATPVGKTTAAAIRFLREARITGRLEHPNIVPVYELGRRLDGSHYYTQKLVRGETLRKKLAACRTLQERLALLGHYLGVCQAMAYAHSRNVIHRDLKPENVMIGEFGETVVLDWGLAKVQGQPDVVGLIEKDAKSPALDGHPSVTVAGHALGTPSYMSPEQALGKLESVDERSDVWSLGAMLYEVLTGQPPFTGDTAFEVIGKVIKDPVAKVATLSPDAPPELVAICQRAVSRDPEQRYGNAKELTGEVEAYQSGSRIKSYEYSSLELVQRFVRKNRALSGVVATSVVLLLAAFGLIFHEYKKEQSSLRVAVEQKRAAEEGEQEVALQRARLLGNTDPLGAIDALANLSQDLPGWTDVRTVAADLIARGVPAWRIEMPDTMKWTQRMQGKLVLADGESRIWELDPTSGALTRLPDSIRGRLADTSENPPRIATDEEGTLRVYELPSFQQIGSASKARHGNPNSASPSGYVSSQLVDGPATSRRPKTGSSASSR